MREQIVRRPPPAVLLAVAGAARGVMTRDRTVTPVSVAAVTAVVGDSLYLLARSTGNFLRHRTTVGPVRVERAQRFVMDGPSRPTRNPMYLGLTDLLLSRAIAHGSPFTPIPLAGFIRLIGRHQIPAEEEALEERFGQDYLDYKKTVPCWLNVPGSSPGDRSREPGTYC